MLLAQCPVCQELFTNGADCVISALPCGHVFHKHCVDTWFRNSATCPQCRIEIKRMNTIVRLFFDTVVGSGQHYSLIGSPDSTETPDKTLSQNQLNIQIYKAQARIVHLEDQLKQTDQSVQQNKRLVAGREKEIATLTTLYTDADKLCEKERQRCRELRLELQGMKQLVREAEAMKTEAVKLRAEMEEMKNVKKLIAASDDAARDLLSRYTPTESDGGTNNREVSYNLKSLCRWAAVLRTELTTARDKSRSYRIEIARVRKLQQVASHRAAKAEANARNANELVISLQQELSRMTQTTNVPDPFSPDSCGRVFETSNFRTTGSDSLGNSIDFLDSPCVSIAPEYVSTPELLAMSPLHPPTVELTRRLRTPVNPFRISGDRMKPPAVTINLEAPQFPTPKQAIHDGEQKKRLEGGLRRHSSLYEMAIMRRHLGPSQSVQPHPQQLNCMPPSRAYQRAADVATKRPAVVKKSISRSSKNSRLDHFVYKL